MTDWWVCIELRFVWQERWTVLITIIATIVLDKVSLILYEQHNFDLCCDLVHICTYVDSIFHQKMHKSVSYNMCKHKNMM